MTKEKRFDPRIGLYEHYDALICPVSGIPVKGKHSTTKRIRDNYHFRVLNKLNLDPAKMEAIKQELLKVVSKATDSKVVKHDKQSQ